MMRLFHNYIPTKTSEGLRQVKGRTIAMPVQLRQLFILIDGKRSIDDLLRLGFSSLDISSFDNHP